MKLKRGWFNWVDVLILVLILSAVGVVLFRDSLFGNTVVSIDGVGGTQALEVTAKALSVPKTSVDAFKIGDKPIANGKELPGEVIAVDFKPSLAFELKDGKLIEKSEPDTFDLYVTFKYKANQYNSYMEIGSQELKVGAQHFMKTGRAELSGYIVKIKKVD